MPLDSTAPSIILRGKATINAVHQYYLNKAAADKLTDDNAALKAIIVDAMEGNAVASCGAHVVRVSHVVGTDSTPNVVITRDMLGTVIPGKKGRAGSTRLEVI